MCTNNRESGNSTSQQWAWREWEPLLSTQSIYLPLDIENGGRTNYTIKVDKQDAQDRIYMHITGRNGNTRRI